MAIGQRNDHLYESGLISKMLIRKLDGRLAQTLPGCYLYEC
jgi:hypothetical protein